MTIEYFINKKKQERDGDDHVYYEVIKTLRDFLLGIIVLLMIIVFTMAVTLAG